MPEQASPQSEYAMGYSEGFPQLLKRRSLDEEAAHPLPHLKSGISVLDCGCDHDDVTFLNKKTNT